jgi:hypothetical protein
MAERDPNAELVLGCRSGHQQAHPRDEFRVRLGVLFSSRSLRCGRTHKGAWHSERGNAQWTRSESTRATDTSRYQAPAREQPF